MSVESFGSRREGKLGQRSAIIRAAFGTAAVVIAGIAASGCYAGWRSAKSPPLPDLTTAQWHLATLNHEAARPADAANRPWLQFNDKLSNFQGSGGCNSISGHYDRNAVYLHFEKMISTARACTDASVNEQEQAFKVVLQNVDRYEITGDTLILSVGADGAARLVR